MNQSRIPFQIDECFIKAIRNESLRRRGVSDRGISDDLDDDFFSKLSQVTKCDGGMTSMKKKVVRTLISAH